MHVENPDLSRAVNADGEKSLARRIIPEEMGRILWQPKIIVQARQFLVGKHMAFQLSHGDQQQDLS